MFSTAKIAKVAEETRSRGITACVSSVGHVIVPVIGLLFILLTIWPQTEGMLNNNI
jgi:hypothetical protein